MVQIRLDDDDINVGDDVGHDGREAHGGEVPDGEGANGIGGEQMDQEANGNFWWNGQFPPAQGALAKFLKNEVGAYAQQREDAKILFQALSSNDPAELKTMNSNKKPNLLLCSIPNTGLVRAIYLSSVDTELDAAGNEVVTTIKTMAGDLTNDTARSPPDVYELPKNAFTKVTIKVPTDAQVLIKATTWPDNQWNGFTSHSLGEVESAEVEVMRAVPVPFFVGVDALEEDADARVIWERCRSLDEADTDECIIHACNFLKCCMVKYRVGAVQNWFRGELVWNRRPSKALLSWAEARVKEVCPGVVTIPHDLPAAAGQNAILHQFMQMHGEMMNAMIQNQQAMALATAAGSKDGSGKKKKAPGVITLDSDDEDDEDSWEAKLGMSKAGKRELLRMCKLVEGQESDIPQVHFDLGEKKLTSSDKDKIILDAIEGGRIYRNIHLDIVVPMLKVWRDKNWRGSGGAKLTIGNCMSGSSVFLCREYSDDTIQSLMDDDKALQKASHTTTKDHKEKLGDPEPPKDHDDLCRHIKRFIDINAPFCNGMSQAAYAKMVLSRIEGWPRNIRDSVTQEELCNIMWELQQQIRYFFWDPRASTRALSPRFDFLLQTLERNDVPRCRDLPPKLKAKCQKQKRREEDFAPTGTSPPRKKDKPSADDKQAAQKTQVVNNIIKQALGPAWHTIRRRKMTLKDVCHLCNTNPKNLLPDEWCGRGCIFANCVWGKCARNHGPVPDDLAREVVDKLKNIVENPELVEEGKPPATVRSVYDRSTPRNATSSSTGTRKIFRRKKSSSVTNTHPTTTPTAVPQTATTTQKEDPSPDDLPSRIKAKQQLLFNSNAPQDTINTVLNKIVAEDEIIPQELPEIKETIGKFGLMQPRTYAMNHPATPLLQEYAEHGCPVDTGPDWSQAQIMTALQRGPHISAYQDGAVEFLRAETKEKITNGYAQVVKWKDIKDALPTNFKLSPVAMVPHKSKDFRCIMDLSFNMRKPDGSFYESVNSQTNKLAPPQAMAQLGSTVKRIISTMADNFEPNKPFYFAKLDIKDGFWRMAVSDDDAWSFCYVLPSRETLASIDETEIVVPNSLQMGWAESPPYFCAGSEMACDVIELLLPHARDLPPHPLETKMLQKIEESDMSISSDDEEMEYVDKDEDEHSVESMEVEFLDVQIPDNITLPTTTLFEVFVDDFIGATNDHSYTHLRNVSRAMLHAIHSVFPPPSVTGHPGGDSISVKKIDKGEGQWHTQAEILGWDFDGETYCIKLPSKKVEKIDTQLRQIGFKKTCRLNDWQKLAGRLQHASMVMPGGWGLFSPFQMAMHRSPKFIFINLFLRHALRDWRVIIKQIDKIPTHILQLVDGLPDYLGSSDSCRWGTGGVWFGTRTFIGFWVWRVVFPQDIIDGLITAENPNGWVTMNDLELAGVVLEWLAIEVIVPILVFVHVGMNCDNTTAVSWATKFRTSKSLIAAILLRFLCVRMHRRRAAPAITINIDGDDNGMADVASRSLLEGASDSTRARLASDILRSWRNIDNGVTAATSKDRQKYWKHWCTYVRKFNKNDVFLQTTSELECVILVTAFAQRVRDGYYGRGRRVTVQTVSNAIAAITASIELVGKRSPLKKEGTKEYILPISRLLEGMRRNDPLPVPQLAIPVAVVEELYRLAYCGDGSDRDKAKADLALIAFYYLLRVGEYTKPRKVLHNGRLRRATRTRQFRLKDIGFFQGDELIDFWNLPPDEVTDTLLEASSATLKITNQKNGRMGQTIHHEAIPNIADGPTQALARRVGHIIKHGGSQNSLLCDVFDTTTNTWDSIQQKEIVDFVRLSVKSLGLQKKGIDPDLVGAHSLRAGGAMAMKLHGESDTTIMKQGRWTSLTFVMYIHNQIAQLSSGLSTKMKTPLPYLNIGNIQPRN